MIARSGSLRSQGAHRSRVVAHTQQIRARQKADAKNIIRKNTRRRFVTEDAPWRPQNVGGDHCLCVELSVPGLGKDLGSSAPPRCIFLLSTDCFDVSLLQSIAYRTRTSRLIHHCDVQWRCASMVSVLSLNVRRQSTVLVEQISLQRSPFLVSQHRPVRKAMD